MDRTTKKSGYKTIVIFICMTAALGGLLFGLDQGFIANSLETIEKVYDLDIKGGENYSAILALGGIFGALFSGIFARFLGRKKSLVLAGFLFSSASLISALIPPFGILTQLADCQIESGHLPEARESLSRINTRFPRIKNDIRQSMKCKLENACHHYGESLKTSKNIHNKDTFIYKKLRRDALQGVLSTSALSDETRNEYKAEFERLDKELLSIQVAAIFSLMFDSDY